MNEIDIKGRLSVFYTRPMFMFHKERYLCWNDAHLTRSQASAEASKFFYDMGEWFWLVDEKLNIPAEDFLSEVGSGQSGPFGMRLSMYIWDPSTATFREMLITAH